MVVHLVQNPTFLLLAYVSISVAAGSGQIAPEEVTFKLEVTSVWAHIAVP